MNEITELFAGISRAIWHARRKTPVALHFRAPRESRFLSTFQKVRRVEVGAHSNDSLRCALLEDDDISISGAKNTLKLL